MNGGNVPTQSWSGKSAVFLMESALTSHGSSKLNKNASDGRGISNSSLISSISLIDGFGSVIMHFQCKLGMSTTMLKQIANITEL